MMKLCTRLVRDLPILIPTSLWKSTIWSKTTSHLPESLYIACRHFTTTPIVLSQMTVEHVKHDVHMKNTGSPLISSVIDNLEVYGFAKDEITQLFESQPRLLNSSVNSWSEVVTFFYTFGFGKAEVIRILEVWPEILRCKTSLLEKNFMAWSNTGLGEELLFAVLTTHPTFLLVDDKLVSKRVKQYQVYFESKKRVGKLFLLAPNVLEESWKSVCDKLNYLDELCTDNSDVVSTGVLRHSLFHTRARHEFLIRAGRYKLPKKDFNKKLSKNPNLDSIVNTTDEEFVSKVARLSLFEYEVFLEFFQQEVKDYESDDDTYDSDDETTYKNNYNTQYKNSQKKK